MVKKILAILLCMVVLFGTSSSALNYTFLPLKNDKVYFTANKLLITQHRFFACDKSSSNQKQVPVKSHIKRFITEYNLQQKVELPEAVVIANRLQHYNYSASPESTITILLPPPRV